MVTRLTLVAVLVSLVSFAGYARAQESKAEVGRPAPDFTLTDASGETHSLSELKGKTVVLEWVNPDCPFVQRHYKAGTMKSLAQSYAGKGVAWMAINTTATTTPEQNQQWIQKYGLSYPILLDRDGKVAREYGAKTTPDMFIINPEGVLVYKGGIDNDPAGTRSERVNYVSQALDEVLAGKPVSQPETKSYGCSVKYAR